MLLNQSTCQVPGRDPRQWFWPQQPKCWRSAGADNILSRLARRFTYAQMSLLWMLNTHSNVKRALYVYRLFCTRRSPAGCWCRLSKHYSRRWHLSGKRQCAPWAEVWMQSIVTKHFEDHHVGLFQICDIMHDSSRSSCHSCNYGIFICWYFCSTWWPAFVRNVDIKFHLSCRYCSNR